jgi:membrane protease YdiL (CAAX protease family)
MRNSVRLILGIVMVLTVYFLAVRVVPSIKIVQQAVKGQRWLSGGDITQITLLIVSLLLIFVLGRGELTTYGLRFISARMMVKPLLTSVIVSLLLLVPGLAIVMRSDPGSMGPEVPGMGMNLLKLILSVWVLASICEEFLFRGLLQGVLEPLKVHGISIFHRHISVPVVVCALGFGLGHLILLGKLSPPMVTFIVINATILGLIAGYHRETTGSIVPAIVVHIAFNVVGGGVPMLLMRIMTR